MTEADIRIFISAAEPSGDLYAAQLIREVRRRRPAVEFLGIAGPAMRSAGCRSVGDMTTHSAMLLGVLGSAKRAWNVLNAAENEFSHQHFDALVVIDSPMLHLPLARRAREHGISVFYYVAPQLWAWGESRVGKLRARVDQMAVILPFEEDYFRQRGLDATYVGHPLFDALATRPADPAEVDRIRAQGAPRVAILPGSRKHVIREVLPGQLAVAGAVCRAFPDTAIGVSVAGTAAEPLVRAIADSCGLPVKLYRERNAELLTAADLTLVASGTATLEVAYYGSPMIVMYNSSRLLYHLMGRWVVRLKQFSLVNILAGTELVPEFMPYYRSTAPIAAKAIELLSKPDRRSDMRRKLAELLEPIRKPGATRRTADLLLAMLNTPTGR